jgi:hypothetical protein
LPTSGRRAAMSSFFNNLKLIFMCFEVSATDSGEHIAQKDIVVYKVMGFKDLF